MPEEFGKGNNIYKYFQFWERAGFFEAIRAYALEEYDDLKGLDWEWQSPDGCMTKAPLAQESAGNNPADRGKKSTKRSLLTEGHGLPIATAVRGANTHDVKLPEETLDNIVICRPEPTLEKPQNLCLDAGYTGHSEEAAARTYIPHIRSRGEEQQLMERDPGFKPRRWVVEVTHSWINRFRKLPVRFEKKDSNYIALLCFACSIIVWRRLFPVHKSPVIV